MTNSRFEDMTITTLLKLIDECRGGRLERDLRALKATSRLYTMNTRELRQSLEGFGHNPLMFTLWSAENRELLNEYYSELFACFTISWHPPRR
jgi:hypothetical protein